MWFWDKANGTLFLAERQELADAPRRQEHVAEMRLTEY
jgi:hypothetical protein